MFLLLSNPVCHIPPFLHDISVDLSMWVSKHILMLPIAHTHTQLSSQHRKEHSRILGEMQQETGECTRGDDKCKVRLLEFGIWLSLKIFLFSATFILGLM